MADEEGEEGADNIENIEADNVDTSKLKLPEGVVFASAPIEIKKGDEDEEQIFKIRTKVFRFFKEDKYGTETRTNLWKERGTGDIRLLRHKVTGKIRVLMRQEKTKKICLNHIIDPTQHLLANNGSDKSWVFNATDYADPENTSQDTMFALKFRDSEYANKYKGAHLFGRRANAKIFGLEFEAEDEDEDNKLILAFEADYAAEVAEKALESAALDKAVEALAHVKLSEKEQAVLDEL